MTFDMQKARAVCEKATPGPWMKAIKPEYDVDYETANHLVGGPTGRDIYDRDIGIFSTAVEGWNSVCSPQLEADADFITYVRALVPALLDRIEELEAKIETTKTDNNHCVVADWKFEEYRKRIEEQAKRIAELDAEAQSYHDRKEEFAGRIAELKESLDDEKYENADALIDICKLRTALKKLGQAKRERGKALVEKEACLTYNTPDEDGHLPIFDFDELSSDAQDLLRERAREQLRLEKVL